MFEKEAKKYRRIHGITGGCDTVFKDGAEFGYNKANEWHYVKDENDLPTDKKEYLLLLGSGIRTFGFYNGRFWESWKGDLSWQEVKAYYDVPDPNEESLNLKGE